MAHKSLRRILHRIRIVLYNYLYNQYPIKVNVITYIK